MSRGRGSRRDPAAVELTDEQERIVAHDEGPAVVFAVAGSGKTTAMVRRVERLVREDVFPAERILATSFSRATVSDLEEDLSTWPHCKGVDVRTIHSLGYKLLARAPEAERPLRPRPGGASLDGADREVLEEAIRRARARGVDYEDELETLDRGDFLGYVGDRKGNLRYADLEAAQLPERALETAGPAQAPDGLAFYLDLYRLFEEVRREQGRVTYDDLLLGGWEALQRFPELREEARRWYDCGVVDEFQDVNRAQHEILDLLAGPQYNYMVVGDDDQTIYEWRGADPSFILDFADNYEAQTYRIQDNFRCPAPQVVLANRVIEHNDHRVEKTLNLTRGFDGELEVRGHGSELALARSVVAQVQDARSRGVPLSEIAVLLRVYAQSAYVEHLLIQEQIPYDLVGARPFYDRSEAQTLQAYVRLAQWDAAQLGNRGANPPPAAELPDLLVRVANQADEARYIPNRRASAAGRQAAREGLTVQQALKREAGEAPYYTADGMRELAGDLAWLATRLRRSSPDEVLDAFDERIGFRAHLRATSGFDETGEGRARNVTAFVDYAGHANDLIHLLEHLDRLRRTHREAKGSGERLDVRTVHRAKGLEWPVVIVPHCNDGTLPFSRAFGDPGRLEEERRLLYVALTRSRRATYLHLLDEEPVSRFLEQARHEETLADVRLVEELLSRSPRRWSPREAVDLVRAVHALELERYLERWWSPGEPRARSVGRVASTVLAQAEEEGLLDRLGAAGDERELWEETLAPPGQPPPGGLGEPIEPLLPEPAAAQPSGETGGAREGPGPGDELDPDARAGLELGADVRHPDHGQGRVLERPTAGAGNEVLVAFEDSLVRRIDLAEETLRVAGDGDEGEATAGDRGSGGGADGSPEGPTSQIYLGKGASVKGWITLPTAVVEEEIVPVVSANVVEDGENAEAIQVNFGSDVSLSGWTPVAADAVRERIEPIVEAERVDGG